MDAAAYRLGYNASCNREPHLLETAISHIEERARADRASPADFMVNRIVEVSEATLPTDYEMPTD